jgi:hypothetical protein
MKIRMLPWSGLSASAVLLAAGAAFSGGATTSDNTLVDYVQATRHLSAYPAGQSSPTTYLHDPAAVHALANLTRFAPPDPCLPLANAWNLTVEFDQHYGVTSTFVFDVLLTVMSDLQCHATIASTSGAVQPIVVITPTY